ncbi:hypothetical protein K7X08_010742 [Anisodus acutangulus]|uniref:Uncharacterized protein n=1 Tax=Anisodus acutangulus TaxID=402998 RepID=A0A9Q1LXV1_9SOLA|nr:hypothetical protein K7X08_010742 [Anisodus acutangulus]
MLRLSRTRISVNLKMRKRSLMGMKYWTKELKFWRNILKVFGFLRVYRKQLLYLPSRVKVFWSYGWALPPIIIALLITGGPKAFLMALAIPLGQSVFSFAIQKMLDATQGKPAGRSKTKKRQCVPTSSKTNFWRRGGSPRTRKRKSGYQSWVFNNDISTSKDEREASRYGGWDELDQETESRTGIKSSAQSSVGPSDIPTEKGKLNVPEAKRRYALVVKIIDFHVPILGFMD